ncbi:protein FAM83G isoform X2 [Eucyclogobius newberryi]|uniref:protein FAM83G isoform X2 n=1 Tax=Eucyclogobius newberryi TaxID=166745 RepID=UPI003B5A2429
MALSQVQCLDNHHVNWRVNESKAEFFYSEDQRLAVEELVNGGREAFMDFIKTHDVRQFLSDAELDRIENYVELYRPGHENHQRPDTPMTPGPGALTPGAGEDEISLQYWPDRSEFSVAELDLGWPEATSYRGVTRVNVHTQPPSDGQTHIKEVVRKSIASAQKVIAVVMDVFTDVDIFRDLLDASYKRRIPVYIIIDTASVPCFLSMCGRADMHRGHLKNLRVRSCGGVEFLTRSAQKVRGSLKEKFLLVDGDRAISGSYSYTWSSSRLDRNVITVITGQAMETFDLQFRELYLQSRGVSLGKIPLADEPVPEPLPQAAPTPVSASVARKLINPKYALVAAGNQISPTSSDRNSSKPNSSSRLPTGMRIMKSRLREVQEEPPLHPGLAHLEKAYMIPYLPTWPDPDPPKDVIGFINIRDEKRANQVHLQRSERFEVSQAIRFTSPLFAPAKKEEKPASTPAEKAENVGELRITEATKPAEVTTLAPASNDKVDGKKELEKDNEPPSQEVPTQKTLTETQPPMDTAKQEVESQPAAPPVPKRRTLQLVIDTASPEMPAEAQVTLVKMDQADKDLTAKKTEPEEIIMTRHRLQSQREETESVSNEEDSQDSTKVICDRGVTEAPSSNSTGSEEEFYDAPADQRKELLANGATSGSNQGPRQGDGLNVMARFSQSMLDLRESTQSEDSMALIRQSQQMRRQNFQSPHRHIGQLFEGSRSPSRAKVIVAKPGSFHRPSGAAAPVIGGHRYWQTQMLQPNPATQTRAGRSPRRHSPGYKKSQQSSGEQPPAAGLLGVSFSKLSNLKHLKARAGVSQKKVPQMNKANR